MGALEPPLDECRLGIFDGRYRAWQLVGVLRTGLGRLVVLGPGRKCIVYALVGGLCADSCAGNHGKARHFHQLDLIAVDRWV